MGVPWKLVIVFVTVCDPKAVYTHDPPNESDPDAEHTSHHGKKSPFATSNPSTADDGEEYNYFQGLNIVKSGEQGKGCQDEGKCNWCISGGDCDPGGCQEVPNFDARKDKEALHNAIYAKPPNEDVVIDILTHRSDTQIKMIQEEYQDYMVALRTDIANSKFKNKKFFLALLQSRVSYYVEEMHKAISEFDHEAMIIMMTSVSPCAIREIGVAYTEKYGDKTSIAPEIRQATSRVFETFLVELTRGNRSPDGPVNTAEAEADAQALIKAGAKSFFMAKNSVFITLFTERSYSQLRQIIKAYNDLRKPKNIIDDIKENLSDSNLLKGLVALVKNILDQPNYFADEMEGALDKLIGSGVENEDTLINIMRSRCGLDLGSIRDAYPRNHNGRQLADRFAEKKKDIQYLEVFESMLRAPQAGKQKPAPPQAGKQTPAPPQAGKQTP